MRNDPYDVSGKALRDLKRRLKHYSGGASRAGLRKFIEREAFKKVTEANQAMPRKKRRAMSRRFARREYRRLMGGQGA